MFFCDISEAFDRVWHQLRDMGCCDEFLNWFSSYLSNRRQRVVINGQTSEWTYVLAGVPQGPILGPLLFLIYINDIVNELQASIGLFADDTSLDIIVGKSKHCSHHFKSRPEPYRYMGCAVAGRFQRC